MNWDMFWAASDDDIEAYSDSVTCFIRKCIEDVIPTKTVHIYPNQKRGLTAMFDQPCQRGHLPLNPETMTIKNKPVTISGDPSKPPNDNIKNKVEEQLNNNNARSMRQGINNITGFKGNKTATVNIAASLPDELNTF